jgi:hypothetical protein
MPLGCPNAERAHLYGVTHCQAEGDSWFTKWGKEVYATHGERSLAIVTAIVYYVDFLTDVRFVIELDRCGDDADSDGLPPFFFHVVLAILVLHPIALTIADQFGGMGVWGLPLNLTNTRMMYQLFKAMCSPTAEKKSAAVRATNDVKLFEAVFESMPQLYIQMIVLL